MKLKYIINLMFLLFLSSCTTNQGLNSLSSQYSGQTDLYEQLLIDLNTNQFSITWQMTDFKLDFILNKSNAIPLEYKQNNKINQELKTLIFLKENLQKNHNFTEKLKLYNELINFKENLKFINVKFNEDFPYSYSPGLIDLFQGYWKNQDKALYVNGSQISFNNIITNKPTQNFQNILSQDVSYFIFDNSSIIFGYEYVEAKQRINNFQITFTKNGILINNLIDNSKLELFLDNDLIVNSNEFINEIKEIISIIESYWDNFKNIESINYDTLYYDKFKNKLSFTITYKVFDDPILKEDSYVIDYINNNLKRVPKDSYLLDYILDGTSLFYEQKFIFQKYTFNNDIKYLVVRNSKIN
jgi:hypothetical protein